METINLPLDHAEQDVVEQLRHDVKGPEDQAVLDSWEREEALKNLGNDVLKMLPDGTIAPAKEIQAMLDAGQERSHPYGNAARR